jgi:hypothetical protein
VGLPAVSPPLYMGTKALEVPSFKISQESKDADRYHLSTKGSRSLRASKGRGCLPATYDIVWRIQGRWGAHACRCGVAAAVPAAFDPRLLDALPRHYGCLPRGFIQRRTLAQLRFLPIACNSKSSLSRYSQFGFADGRFVERSPGTLGNGAI